MKPLKKSLGLIESHRTGRETPSVALLSALHPNADIGADIGNGSDVPAADFEPKTGTHFRHHALGRDLAPSSIGAMLQAAELLNKMLCRGVGIVQLDFQAL